MDSSHTPDLSKTPALKPPPGVIPNFQNPSNIGTTVIVVNAVLLVLMFVFLAMRIYVKAAVSRGLWWDDFSIVLSAVSNSPRVIKVWELTLAMLFSDGFFCTFGVGDRQNTVGTHMWDIPLSHLTPSFIHTLTAGNIVYNPTVLLIKLSMILLYHRLFSINRTMKWITWGATTFLVLFYVAETCVAIAVESQCTHAPPWPSLCSDLWKNTITQAVINTVTDLAVLLLPITKVLSLHMPLRRKIGVSAIFGIGLLACVASLIRMAFVIRYAHSADSTWTGGLLSIFSAIEINVGIIAGCLIALPPLVKKYPVRSLGSIGSWSLRSLRSRFLRKSAKADRASSRKGTGDSFHGISVHLPTAGGFTELGDVGGPPSVSEGRSLEERKTNRYVTEAFAV